MRGCGPVTIIQSIEELLEKAKRGDITDVVLCSSMGNKDYNVSIALGDNPVSANQLLICLSKAQYMINQESCTWYEKKPEKGSLWSRVFGS